MAIDVRSIVEQAIRAALDPVPIEGIEVEQRPDHTDEDALYITVILPPATPVVGGKKYLAAMTAVSDALLATGEHRFPYVRLHHGGEEPAEEASWSDLATP